MEKELEKMKLMDIFNFEMSQVEPAVMLQLNGLPIDMDVRKRILTDIDEKQVILTAELEQEFGKSVNLNSPKQMQNLLYEDMGLPIQYKRRKSVNDPRKRTADEEAIAKLARITNNPLLSKIIESVRNSNEVVDGNPYVREFIKRLL